MSSRDRSVWSSARFLGQFLFKPATTGAVAPSSEILAEAMVEGLNLRNAAAVLEYGPGTGVFTEYILKGIGPATKFVAIEINPSIAELFRQRHPAVALSQESVANVRSICDRAGISSVDCIVSGLPWATFSESLQAELMDATMKVLRPGGQFVTFCYVHSQVLPPAQSFAKVLPRYFSKVSKSPIVWWNLPPAFVYRCVR